MRAARWQEKFTNKMEVYYAATGPKNWLDLHETHMQSQQMWLPYTATNGQVMQQAMMGILEPIMLYRYVIPKAALPIVMKTLTDGKINPLISKLKIPLL